MILQQHLLPVVHFSCINCSFVRGVSCVSENSGGDYYLAASPDKSFCSLMEDDNVHLF